MASPLDLSGKLTLVDAFSPVLDKFRGGINDMAAGLVRGGLAAGAAYLSFDALKNAIHEVWVEAGQAEQSMVRLDLIMKGVGATSGFTMRQMTDLATQIEATSTSSDEAVMDAERNLLKFGVVHGDVMKRALMDSANAAELMGTSIESAAQMIGRALVAPGEGMRRLTMLLGVKMTEAEIAAAKSMVEMGRAGEAQAMVLAKIEERTNGAAEAMRGTMVGSTKALENSFSNLKEAIGFAIFDKGGVLDFAMNLTGLSKAAGTEGGAASQILNLSKMVDTLTKAFDPLSEVNQTLTGWMWNASLIDNLGIAYKALSGDIDGITAALKRFKSESPSAQAASLGRGIDQFLQQWTGASATAEEIWAASMREIERQRQVIAEKQAEDARTLAEKQKQHEADLLALRERANDILLKKGMASAQELKDAFAKVEVKLPQKFLDDVKRSEELTASVVTQEERRAAAIAEATRLMKEYQETNGRVGITTETYNRILRQNADIWKETEETVNQFTVMMEQAARDLASGLQNAMMGFFTEVIETGKLNFESLFDSIKKMFAQLLAKLLTDWITNEMQRTAATAKQAAIRNALDSAKASSGTSGGGSGIGVLSNLAGGGGGGGAAAGGSGMMAAAGWAVVFALWAKVLTGLYKGFTEKKMQWGEAGFGGQTAGSSAKFRREMETAIDAMRKDMADLARQLGLGAIDVSRSTAVLGKNEFGYYVKAAVTAVGVAFQSLQEAQEYLRVLVIQQTIQTSRWASSLMQEVVQSSRAMTTGELSGQMDIVRQIEAALTGGGGLADMRSFLQSMEEMRRQIADLVHTIPNLVTALSGLNRMEADRWQAWRDQITGTQRTQAQELAYRKQQAELFNAELKMRIADLRMKKLELEANLALLRARGELLSGGRGGDTAPEPPVGGNNPGGTEPPSGPAKSAGGLFAVWQAELEGHKTYVLAKAELVKAELSTYEQHIAALEANIAAIAELLGRLEGMEIDIGRIKLPRAGGAGGADNPIQQWLDDVNKRLRQFGMNDYARQLDDINARFKELMKPLTKAVKTPKPPVRKEGESDADFKKRMDDYKKQLADAARHAGRNAEQIRKLNEARKKEIELLRKQVEQDYARYLQPQGTDYTRSVDDFLKQLDTIPREVMPNWEKAIVRQRFLAEQLKSVTDQIREFGGDPALAVERIHQQAADLAAAVQKLFSEGAMDEAEKNRRLAMIAAGEQYQLQQMLNGILDNLYGYLKDDAKWQGRAVEFAKMKVQLEFAVMKAQLVAMGVFDQYAELWGDALAAAMAEAENAGQAMERGAQAISNAFDTWLSPEDLRKRLMEYVNAGAGGGGFNAELADLTHLFWNAIDGFAYQAGAYGIEMDLVNRAWEAALESLRQKVLEPIHKLREDMLGSKYSIVSPQQQLNSLVMRMRTAYTAAIGGDLNAYATYADLARQLLDMAQSNLGAGGYAYYYQIIDAMNAMLEAAGIEGSALAAQQNADATWQQNVLLAMQGTSVAQQQAAAQAHADASDQNARLDVLITEFTTLRRQVQLAGSTPLAA